MSPKGPPSFFSYFAKEWMFKNSQRPPFCIFGLRFGADLGRSRFVLLDNCNEQSQFMYKTEKNVILGVIFSQTILLSESNINIDNALLRISGISSLSFMVLTVLQQLFFYFGKLYLSPFSDSSEITYVSNKLCDLCVIFRGGGTFILYMIWSQQFRQTFLKLFASRGN